MSDWQTFPLADGGVLLRHGPDLEMEIDADGDVTVSVRVEPHGKRYGPIEELRDEVAAVIRRAASETTEGQG